MSDEQLLRDELRRVSQSLSELSKGFDDRSTSWKDVDKAAEQRRLQAAQQEFLDEQRRLQVAQQELLDEQQDAYFASRGRQRSAAQSDGGQEAQRQLAEYQQNLKAQERAAQENQAMMNHRRREALFEQDLSEVQATPSFQSEQYARAERGEVAERFRLMCVDIIRFCEYQDQIIELLNAKEFNTSKWKTCVQGAGALQLLGGITGLTIGIGALVVGWPVTGPVAVVSVVAGAAASIGGAGTSIGKAGIKEASQSSTAMMESTKIGAVVAGKEVAFKPAVEAISEVTMEMVAPVGAVLPVAKGTYAIYSMSKVDPKAVYQELKFRELSQTLIDGATEIGNYYSQNQDVLNKQLFQLVTGKMLSTNAKIESYNPG